MIDKRFVQEYWLAIATQDRDELRDFFNPKAIINWHDSNESFTLEEFIIANCDYPSSWTGEIQRIEWLKNKVITVTKVFSDDMIVHAVSFFEFVENEIMLLDEYWSECGEAPQWRLDKNIGRKIRG